jgi:hypothetical protein
MYHVYFFVNPDFTLENMGNIAMLPAVIVWVMQLLASLNTLSHCGNLFFRSRAAFGSMQRIAWTERHIGFIAENSYRLV